MDQSDRLSASNGVAQICPPDLAGLNLNGVRPWCRNIERIGDNIDVAGFTVNRGDAACSIDMGITFVNHTLHLTNQNPCELFITISLLFACFSDLLTFRFEGLFQRFDFGNFGAEFADFAIMLSK